MLCLQCHSKLCLHGSQQQMCSLITQRAHATTSMGKRSTERCTCRVTLSVTNAFKNMVCDAVKAANVGLKIKAKTWNCAKLVEERWRFDSGLIAGAMQNAVGVLGPLANVLAPVHIVAGAACTHVFLEYDIDVDMYNLIRCKLENGSRNRLLNYCIKKSRFSRIPSQAMKLFKRTRRRLIYLEMQREIEREFQQQIRNQAGIFKGVSAAAVSVNSVRVTTL